MILRNFLRRFVPGDPVYIVADTKNLNRMANILEDIEVVGTNGISAEISKPTDAEGRGWIIAIDGAQLRSMIAPPAQGVKKTLQGSGTTPDQTTWTRGETQTVDGEEVPTYPEFKPIRIVWDDTNHKLLAFVRTMSYDTAGNLAYVSGESSVADSTVYTAVAEMP